ncbi:HIT-like protein [Mycena vitilis]|nr:HIT-like protein [Mycena vitilis]
MATNSDPDCLFCNILKQDRIPSLKLIETDLSYSFLDIGPLSKGHALVIPRYHAQKLHELPDEYLADAMPVAKKIVLAQIELAKEQRPKDYDDYDDYQYNVLQNSGRNAHQEVNHVHFHVIPKVPKGPAGKHKWDESEGLVVGWPRMFKELGEEAKEEDKLKAKEEKEAALKDFYGKIGAKLKELYPDTKL